MTDFLPQALIKKKRDGQHLDEDEVRAFIAGASGIEILSPTPPVECLSIFGRAICDRSITSPERVIASAHVASSRPSSPRRNTAISIAACW